MVLLETHQTTQVEAEEHELQDTPSFDSVESFPT